MGDAKFRVLKAHLREIDARKVRIVKMRLTAIEGEHRAAVGYAMRSDLDKQTRRGADDVVSRHAEERKLVLEDTKPFMDGYQERVAELLEFNIRFQTLLQTLPGTVLGADVDARAM
jgi:hypothetical protein